MRRQAAQVIDGLFHHVDGARALGIDLGHPERFYLVLKTLHAMAEEAGLLRRAFAVDEHRQVAAQTHRVHGFEEEGAVAAEQVLHVMLRRRDQNIDARLVHEPVEERGIERGGVLALGDVEHDRSPGSCEFVRAYPIKSASADEPVWIASGAWSRSAFGARAPRQNTADCRSERRNPIPRANST